jgi:signal transduction histidine kinase
MPSQWLGVGAETDPLTRALELRKSWERLVAEGALGPELPPGGTAGLRPTIVESWHRSLATGLDPTDLLAPIEADESEVLERWLEHPLGSFTHVLREQLQKVADESRSMVVVTDASGLVLHRVGNESLKERAAEMNLVEGARYSEAADGTNGIGTALAADHAFQVFAFEHFNERHHEWVCSGAPVHDPASGQVIGLIDLSSLWKAAHPRSLELVTTAAKTIEQCLLDARCDRDARLRRRYSDLMTRGTDLLVDRDGYMLDGAGTKQPTPFDIPEEGGEVVLRDGSVAIAEPLGHGEAYLVRQAASGGSKSAPIEALERSERHVRELAIEQSALRQVATLVARESAPDQLFAAVAGRVARIFDVPYVRLVRYEPDGSVVVGGSSEGDHKPFPIGSHWPLDSPGVAATVRKTGRPARVEDYADMTGEIAAVVRGAGMHSAVASPIVVERRLWGAMVVLSPRPLPEDTEARLTDFAELVATAIANAESRVAIGRLADEHAALRRVATLVAEEAAQEQVFDTIASEAMQLLRTDAVRIVRYDGDSGVVLAGSGQPEVTPPGFRFPLDGDTVAARIFRQGKPARQDEYNELSGSLAEAVRALGIRSVVGAPVLVEGRLWGAITTGMTREEPLPPDTESRLGEFTALMATAISNAEARVEVERLAEEQAALRRVAVLVAHQPSPSDVFTAVTEAVGLLLDADLAVLHVFPGDGMATTIASWSGEGPILPIGTRFPLDGDNLAARIFKTGAPARLYSDDEAWKRAETDLARNLGMRSAVGAPILVAGRLWGALMAATRGVEPWAENAETRIAAFTELVATAIANAEAREALANLAAEQAALRRVATLVARRTEPEPVFRAVCNEVQALLGADLAGIFRFHGDQTVTVMATSGGPGQHPVGTRVSFDPGFVVDWVHKTNQGARFDTDDPAAADMAEIVRTLGVRSAVGSPIVVDGGLWGVITLASVDRSFPLGMEQRLADFTELVATAIAKAESKSALDASRRRIVAASDETRRRIERDLHDGTQQRLVSLGLAVRAAEASVPPRQAELREALSRIAVGLTGAVDDLQELSRGIHPAILSRGGLVQALRALARRSAVPVELRVPKEVSVPEPVEVAAYFVASEALANATKHAEASHIEISLAQMEGRLLLAICDDGLGGADPARGSGLVGLTDRVEALGGSLDIESRPGAGTQITVRLPLELESVSPEEPG